MTLTREEAQQVLDAFVNWDARGRLRLIETLRTRLAQPEHWSDCAVHSEPAYPAGECDCGGVQPEPEQDDGVCGNCNGNGCKFCDARYLIAEPVAWEYCGALFYDKEEVFAWYERGDIGSAPPKPLYTTPPQREWQTLTSTERKVLWKSANNPKEYADLLEAKLKEKNT
jgi:hypothetical protein